MRLSECPAPPIVHLLCLKSGKFLCRALFHNQVNNSDNWASAARSIFEEITYSGRGYPGKRSGTSDVDVDFIFRLGRNTQEQGVHTRTLKMPFYNLLI
jgi:hypothetical protein